MLSQRDSFYLRKYCRKNMFIYICECNTHFQDNVITDVDNILTDEVKSDYHYWQFKRIGPRYKTYNYYYIIIDIKPTIVDIKPTIIIIIIIIGFCY